MSRSELLEGVGPALAPVPSLEWGVPGPHQQKGFVLRAPRVEALVWDLENEVVSARRRWMDEAEGWWIAASYLDAVLEIVLRSFASVMLLHFPEGDRLVSRDGSVVVQERLF